MINDAYDLACWILSGVGLLLLVFQLYLHDWSLEKLLYGEEDDE